jgi:hypothetical protein
VRADLVQQRPKVLDEVERRLEQGLLVALLVGLKPLAAVVLGQLAQEGEQRRGETGCGHRISFGGSSHE